jgi:hypothetical protein
MGCAQSKVSKMESSTDPELNFGDLIRFALALKQAVFIAFSPARKNGADHIRFHVECIKHELEQLVKTASDDRASGDGIEVFAVETVQNMVKVIEESLDKLPHRTQKTGDAVTVEVEGERGQRLPLDGPKRCTRSKGKAACAT